MSERRTIGAVFARGGSKGIVNKNLRCVAGRPLLVHSLDALKQVPGLWRIVVSTDDADIANTARSWGAEVIERPGELARDDSPEWAAWQHLVDAIGSGWGDRPGDILLSAPTTSPLRAPDDLARAVARLHDDKIDGVISVTPAARNPFFNMVTLTAEGHAQIVMRPATPVFRRQDAPVVYDVTTVAYAVRAGFIRRAPRLFAGTLAAIVVPPERALDIDSEYELQIAEMFLTKDRSAGDGPTPT